MAQQWQSGKPPNETTVEVECAGNIITVEAFYGRDGSRPHWRNKDGICWDVSAFRRWRHVSPNDRVSDRADNPKDEYDH